MATAAASVLTSKMGMSVNPQTTITVADLRTGIRYLSATSGHSSEWSTATTSATCTECPRVLKAVRFAGQNWRGLKIARVNRAFGLEGVSMKRNLRGGTAGAQRPVVMAQSWNGSGSYSSTEETPAAALRRVLAEPGVHQGPACFDGLSARLVEQAGFRYTFMSGFAVSAARLGAPDVGLLSYGEVLEQGRLITSAVAIPVIGDGDNGYGNALNVKRTVKGFIQAGFAGIIIEDQVSPKSCGHFGGKKVASREEALTRIKAAVDARTESGRDIVIIARSDARQAESLEEALWRVECFALLGADVLFVDALASKDEMLAFCKVAPGTPKMANMLEGGGRTPILTPTELGNLGFKLVAYPLSMIGVSIRAMQDALISLKSGCLPPPQNLPTFDEIKCVVGIDKYYEEDARYASPELPASLPTETVIPDVPSSAENTQSILADTQGINRQETPPILEDNDDGGILSTTAIPEENSVVYVDSEVIEDNTESLPQNSLATIGSRALRLKITESNGTVKLDVRIPALFLDGFSKTIPVVAGVNLQRLLDSALAKLGGNLADGQQLVDFTDSRGLRIQVFLE